MLPVKMHQLVFKLSFILCFVCTLADETQTKLPTVLVVSLFRNKAHVLPYFFSYLEQLDYPKNRISLWFRSDHNEDNTTEVINTWLLSNSELYHNVNFEHEAEPKRRPSEKSPTHWPEERHLDVIRIKEKGFSYARAIWADYVFFLDADVLLIDPDTMRSLIESKEPIIAPMLISDSLYSNFWCGMSEHFYYQRTDEYKEIYHFEKRGKFPVPMIHSAVLIDLRDIRSDKLTFNKTILEENLEKLNGQPLPSNIPIDDIIVFALSANYSGFSLHVSNDVYGFVMVPLEEDDSIQRDLDQLTNIKIHIVNDIDGGVVLNSKLAKFVQYPEKTTLTLSKIFMINLVRRPERRWKMERSFIEIGLDVTDFPAVDGAELKEDMLDEIGVSVLKEYADPYHNRPMTMGEIGCFLSHYYIWMMMIDDGLDEVLILEDDIRFEPYFVEKALNVINEARKIGGWDLIYFGRKRLDNQDEDWVENSKILVHAGYSYWTLGYIISLKGAQKLIDAKPLEKLIPVDEFLPIMFDKHLNKSWKNAFEHRNLNAWSAAPLILFPIYYTGEEGYISDTEDSVQIKTFSDFQGVKRDKKGNKEIYSPKSNSDGDREVELLREAINKVLGESPTPTAHTEL